MYLVDLGIDRIVACSGLTLQTLPENPAVISNEDLQRIEDEQMDGKLPSSGEVKPSTPAVDQSEIIKAENPELSKVLSEEPLTGKSTFQRSE